MSEVFLDTSIVIAQVVHSQDTKRRIADRVSKYEASVISLVVRQEYKRRLLKEAQYLLNQLNDKGSLIKVHRHVVDVLSSSPFHSRKRNICLEMITEVFETGDDKELTERAFRYLRTMLRCGLSDLDNRVNYELTESECACAQYPVTEKSKYKRYEFGPDECRRTGASCGIERFLRLKEKKLREILTYLRALPAGKKTDELKNAESFIEKLLVDFTRALSMNSCSTVGDLIIALESSSVPVFYTLNRKESLHLCRVTRQDLLVRPKNPAKDDEEYLQPSSTWPDS